MGERSALRRECRRAAPVVVIPITCLSFNIFRSIAWHNSSYTIFSVWLVDWKKSKYTGWCKGHQAHSEDALILANRVLCHHYFEKLWVNKSKIHIDKNHGSLYSSKMTNNSLRVLIEIIGRLFFLFNVNFVVDYLVVVHQLGKLCGIQLPRRHGTVADVGAPRAADRPRTSLLRLQMSKRGPQTSIRRWATQLDINLYSEYWWKTWRCSRTVSAFVCRSSIACKLQPSFLNPWPRWGWFPGRLISHFRDVHWPARSPDLTVLDFFLYVFSKSRELYEQATDLSGPKVELPTTKG